MKTSLISYLLSAISLTLTGVSVLDAQTEVKPTGTSATQTSAPNPKGMLDKGMTAGEIVKLIGKPLSITPLKMDQGKAEKWIYRHEIGQRVVQEATDVANEAAFVGNGGPGNNDQGARVTLLYSTKIISTYQTTALLMINDRLELAKQWEEDQVTYDH